MIIELKASARPGRHGMRTGAGAAGEPPTVVAHAVRPGSAHRGRRSFHSVRSARVVLGGRMGGGMREP